MRLNIRLKLVAFTVCVILLVGGSISLYFIYQGRQRVLTTFEENSGQVASVISGTIVNDLYFLDVHALRLKLESVRTNPDISYIYVIDLQGVVLADGTKENALRNQKLTDNFSEEVLRSAGWVSRLEGVILKVGGPIFMPDRSRIGYLLLGFSLDPAYRIIHETTKSSLYIAVICLGIGVVLAFIIATSFSLPILSIVQASREIGEGKLATRLEVKRDDELGALAESINQMAGSLQARQAEVEQRAQEQAALNTIATATSQSLDLDKLLQIALDKVLEVMEREKGYIRLKDPATDKLRLAVHRGISEEYIEVLMHRRTQGGKGERVFESGEVLIVNDSEGTTLKKEAYQEGLSSVAWIPLKARGKVVGILNVCTSRSVPFKPREVELLKAIGNVIGVALENARLFEETQRNLERVRALRDIDRAITTTLDLRTVLGVLLEKIDLVLPYSAATVRLFNKESGLLEPVACRNLDEEEWKVPQWKGGRGLANVVFETKAPLMVLNAQADPRVRDPGFYRKHMLTSYMGVPLIVQEEVLGVLNFYTKEEHEFSSEEVEFLSTLAGQAAVAIHNSQLYEEMSQMAGELSMTNRRLEKSLKDLSGLYTALTPLAPAESIHKVLDEVIEKLMESTGAEMALIRLQDKTRVGFVAAQRGFPDYYLKAVETVKSGSAADLVLRSGEPIIASDIAAESRLKGKIQLQMGLRSCAMLPLKVRGEVRGIMHLASRELGYFKEEQRDHLMAVARQMGITLENREFFDELRVSRDELARSNKVKDEFLSVMSHELRTPLNVVMGYTGMIKDRLLGEINPEQEQALEKVISRARDQLTLISDILQVTQMEAEGVKVEIGEVSLRDFLDDLRSNYAISLGKQLSIIWDYPSDLLVINTDGEKLKHILQNLINNGIKFTERGNVTVSARYLNGTSIGENSQRQEKGDSVDGAVEFKVSDTGIGIAKENFPLVFGKFRQVDSSETRHYGGVGIGLYIVKQFTELLGGKIDVESEVGKGSTFTVTIPVAIHQGAGKQETRDLASSAYQYRVGP